MTKTLVKVTTGVLASALVLTLFAPAAVAQTTTPGFGTQVKFGDNDFVPTVAALVAANTAFICQINFGDPASIQDDGFYMVFRAAAPAAGAFLANNDLRLVPPSGMGKTSGTLIGDADTVEKATGFAIVCWAPVFGVVDVNTNARYDAGDWMIIDSGVAGTLVNAPAGTAAGFTPGDIRLTKTDTFNAGTLVLGGNSDVVARGGAFAAGAGFPALEVVWYDNDLSATYNGLKDRVYVSTCAAAVACPVNSLVAINDVRVYGEGFTFGSQVLFGDKDFFPTVAALVAANTAFICQINFGDPASIQDDGFYMVFRAAAPAAGAFLANNDLRLVPPSGMGKTAGTIIADADTVEKATGFAIVCWAPVFGVVDVNTNARYDAGDWLVIDSGAAATLVNAPAGTAAGFTPGDIRLTKMDAFLAGTLVLGGNADVVARGGAFAAGAGFPAIAVRWYDNDLSATYNGLKDRLYASTAPAAAGSKVAINDVRLYGDAGEFGTQVKFADKDFIPTVAALVAANTAFICQINFGDPASIQDDGFYMVFRAAAPAAGAFLANNDLRLVPPSGMGKTSGTIIGDADTVEKATGFAIVCWAPVFGVVDVNTNARYDEGDWVIIDSGVAGTLVNAPAGTAAGFTPGDIRLTKTDNFNAGTLVLGGNSDVVARGGAFAAGAGFPALAVRWYDNDLSATYNGLLDRLYVSSAPAAAGSLVAISSVRLYGDFSVGAGGVGGQPPSPTTPTSPTSPTTPTSPTSPTSPTTPTSPPSETQQLLAQIAQLNSQLNTSLSQNSQLNQRITDLSGQLSEQTTQLNNLNTQLSDLRSENTRLQGELTKKDQATKTPGFEAVAVLGALGVALLVLRRKN